MEIRRGRRRRRRRRIETKHDKEEDVCVCAEGWERARPNA